MNEEGAKGKKPKHTFLSRLQTLFSTMTRKPVFKRTLAIFFVIVALYALLNTFFQSYDPSTFDSATFPFNTATASSILLAAGKSTFPAVKVYLYDLPRRFTYGVIQHHSLARGSRVDENDLSSLKYPGHQHMAEWYLFSDLARSDSERAGSPVVRVLDPEEADLFFVPFFSSLSLIVNPVRPPGSGSEKTAYVDEENQEALVEWLKRQEYWQRSKGRDHVIVASDPNAMYRVIDRVKNSVLLVSDFGRLRPDQGSLVKDVIVPYSHRIKTYTGDVGIDKRNTLLFFMGNRYRKEVMLCFL